MLTYHIHDTSYKLNRYSLGNKGVNLANIARLNLPTPEGFIISAKVWQELKKNSNELPDNTWLEIQNAIKKFQYLERSYLSSNNPLLVSVRSGSAYSMPGMMDSILNLGINDKNLTALARQVDSWTAYDSYRRLIQMFAVTVFNIDEKIFLEALDNYLKKLNKNTHIDLSAAELKQLIDINKAIVNKYAKQDFPQDLMQQFKMAVLAVFKSWDKPGAVAYREFNGIPSDVGTAVVVQRMVFGNFNRKSGTGVYFTRNPRTGENKTFGEFLSQSQGEDVVGGQFLPQNLELFPKLFGPNLFEQLYNIGSKLEKHFHRVQDIEFTVEDGKLYILQTRNAKLTGKAAFKIADDMLKEESISIYDAIRIIQPGHISEIRENKFTTQALVEKYLGKGLPASSGVCTGPIALSVPAVNKYANQNQKPILVTQHIDPNDIATLMNCTGVITTKGGSASHMAIILRAMSMPGIVGCEEIDINFAKKQLRINDQVLNEGNYLSFSGSEGGIYKGKLEITGTENLSKSQKKILALREDRLGRSAWSAACYKVAKKFNRTSYLEKIKTILATLNLKSSKARVVALINQILPESEIIPMWPVSPDDDKAIKAGLIRIINSSGFENSPRTTHYPEKISGAPWTLGPNSIAEIDKFMYSDWPGKYAGLKEWKKDKTLESILICKEKTGKLDPRFTHEHFAFTVSLQEGSNPKVVVSISLGSPHLRQFERTNLQDLIVMTAAINTDAPNNLGSISLRVGKKHLRKPLQQRDILFEDLKSFVDAESLAVILTVKDKIFNKWWKPPIALPHLMSALEDSIGISVLEGQGRVKNAKVEWCLIYGVKGSEEKEKIENYLDSIK